MPQVSMAENPALAAQLLREVEEANQPKQPQPPSMRSPVDGIFELCAGYQQDSGIWTTKFEVRELTGRDEEALGRITDTSRVILALMERGLVRVGEDEASPTVIDSLLGGDWETVLIAIRTVTFGPEVESTWTCFNCRKEFTTIFDLSTAKRRTITEDEVQFQVEGRRGKIYEVEHPYGSTQRKILSRINSPGAELNTLLLADCIQSVNGMPSLGIETVLNLGMADRKLLISEIDARQVGPVLKEVKSDCPSCGVEQATPINVAALFR